MQRHPALIPLSRDHHAALVLARAARWAAEGRKGTPEDLRARVAATWRDLLAAHFEVEERWLLPCAGAHAAQLAGEHAALRELTARVEIATEAAALAAALAAFGAALERHIRWEERELFPALEARLSAPELQRLGDDLASDGPGGACQRP